MSQFKFVTSDGAETQLPAAISSLRSHAIRSGLQHGPSTLRKQGAHQSRETIKNKTQLKGRFRLSGAAAKGLGTSTKRAMNQSDDQQSSKSSEVSVTSVRYDRRAPYSTSSTSIQRLCTIEVDPFDSLPITRNRQVESLLRYFLTGFNLNLSTVDPRTAWFPYAMQSSATMHATLALAAAFWSAKLPSLAPAIQQEGLRQKGEVMRDVMTQVAQRDFTSGSLTYRLLLASIANLVNIEAFSGDFRAADVHFKAAYALFQACGGTASVQDDYVLCKCLNWVDLQLAVGLGRVPLFPAFHSLEGQLLPQSFDESALAIPLQNSEDAEDVAVESVFRTIRQAITAQASATTSPHTVRVLGNTADRHILRCLHGKPDDDYVTLSRRQKHTTAVLLAAQIFLYIVLRQLPTNSPLIRTLRARLRRALGHGRTFSDLQKTWEGQPRELLWVFFVGVLATGTATENDETKWYISLLKSAIIQLSTALTQHFSRRQGLKCVLSNILWEERCCEPVLVIIFPNEEILHMPCSAQGPA